MTKKFVGKEEHKSLFALQWFKNGLPKAKQCHGYNII